ncbi:hydroxyisourate hydrolase [Bacillaceae bacterium Marseille-Q3522]|nr:hydroxyisourate hydrolase [Bacillaceae bacterium Marseille-Q3522]
MSGLTTHVLDLAHGRPAAQVKVELFRVEKGKHTWLKEAFTNEDGRLDEPLLTTGEMQIGEYELTFHVGEYFRGKTTILPEPQFLSIVPVRFGISNNKSHYHVPLLISPWGYQVYRGS